MNGGPARPPEIGEKVIDKHPEFEALVAYCDEGPGDEELVLRVRAHLDEGCVPCGEKVRELRLLITDLRATARRAAPESMKEKAKNRVPLPAARDRIEQLLAEVIYDSRGVPALAGERGAAVDARRLLYRAEEYEIAVRISKSEEGSAEVVGQVLKGEHPDPDVAGMKVTLEREGRLRSATTDDLGGFRFERVREGSYRLTLASGKKLVALPEFEVAFP
jgi:hypothetical protein